MMMMMMMMQATIFAKCVKSQLPEVKKGSCELEFLALRTCYRTALKQSS